ncbi:hypothetical protein [Chromobacterium piscinae]|uniref:hypothetical protein n=1 Tax=Chromobacterium piscinae TaxID=686831 RepID=UPI003F7FF18C
MHIFFDTEFTQLSHEAKLISVGMVSEHGGEFYAELADTWRLDDCSDFVKNDVLLHLEGGSAMLTKAELCLHLGNWLESFEVPVYLVTDAPTWDWPWLDYIFDEDHLLPANLERSPVLFTPSEEELETLHQQEQFRHHHALDDARALRLAWLNHSRVD